MPAAGLALKVNLMASIRLLSCIAGQGGPLLFGAPALARFVRRVDRAGETNDEAGKQKSSAPSGSASCGGTCIPSTCLITSTVAASKRVRADELGNVET
ncbi:unnamed protein product [Clonostachys chloroleuca]|uniref:Secreted protein n=1 Tax=Clonostachys chloroleuca TaxID=1926264 RepID=A0AA35MCZ6_9HYPO|nr:unnamed protein product [Clonostachys chloroleuca]